jgi:hypothetical protein
MGAVEAYHVYAEECFRKAQQESDPLDKALWLGLAQSWLGLAEDLALLNGGHPQAHQSGGRRH